MESIDGSFAESSSCAEQTGMLAPSHPALAKRESRRVNLKQDDLKNGLAQLVLTLVKLLHELLERQAIRRIEAGALDDREIERLGTTLMRQSEEIRRVADEFHLDDEDLNLDLGPIGRLF